MENLSIITLLIVSHLTRGAWIEIAWQVLCFHPAPSHLTRGAWIEMSRGTMDCLNVACRTSHEVRGLKYVHHCERCLPFRCRTSHEVRGLKYQQTPPCQQLDESHLTRGAWIEISNYCVSGFSCDRSHLTRGAWIEMRREKI